jgi:ubiquinone/menaquinone biosynthesis C-methylase UbiE
MKDIKRSEIHQLLGEENTVEQNFRWWSAYDWSNEGKEWCISEEWVKSIVRFVMLPALRGKACILEIGPGAGVWSEILAKFSQRLILVDIVPQCLDMCRQKLASADHVSYELNDGRSLAFIGDHEVDGIWSIHTFVHINEDDVLSYFSEFKRILKAGGVAVIHHGGKGNTAHNMGWRSNVTRETISQICDSVGLELIRQFSSWGKNGQYRFWPRHSEEDVLDVFSVIGQPITNSNGNTSIISGTV